MEWRAPVRPTLEDCEMPCRLGDLLNSLHTTRTCADYCDALTFIFDTLLWP